MPQKADVLKKGKIKNTEAINKLSTKLMCKNFLLRTIANIKTIMNDIIVLDNWKFVTWLENGLRYACTIYMKGIV